MKNFLNINKQRIFALLFALIIASSTCIFCFGTSVNAATVSWDYLFPVGFICDTSSRVVGTSSFACTGTLSYNGLWEPVPMYGIGLFTDAMNISRLFVMLSDDASVYDPESSVLLYSDGWLFDDIYLYFESVLVDSDQLVLFANVLDLYGDFVLFDGHYAFDSVLDGGFLRTDYGLHFTSNGQTFDGMSIFTNLVFFPINAENGISVYSKSSDQWLDDSYRFLNFSRSVPSELIVYRFLIDNEAPPPSFLDRVSSGLTAVIGWVGVMVSAVISGPLSPLLGLVAVGIAVSAILIVIYLVRRFIWGA